MELPLICDSVDGSGGAEDTREWACIHYNSRQLTFAVLAHRDIWGKQLFFKQVKAFHAHKGEMILMCLHVQFLQTLKPEAAKEFNFKVKSYLYNAFNSHQFGKHLYRNHDVNFDSKCTNQKVKKEQEGCFLHLHTSRGPRVLNCTLIYSVLNYEGSQELW